MFHILYKFNYSFAVVRTENRDEGIAKVNSLRVIDLEFVEASD